MRADSLTQVWRTKPWAFARLTRKKAVQHTSLERECQATAFLSVYLSINHILSQGEKRSQLQPYPHHTEPNTGPVLEWKVREYRQIYEQVKHPPRQPDLRPPSLPPADPPFVKPKNQPPIMSPNNLPAYVNFPRSRERDGENGGDGGGWWRN